MRFHGKQTVLVVYLFNPWEKILQVQGARRPGLRVGRDDGRRDRGPEREDAEVPQGHQGHADCYRTVQRQRTALRGSFWRKIKICKKGREIKCLTLGPGGVFPHPPGSESEVFRLHLERGVHGPRGGRGGHAGNVLQTGTTRRW